MAFCTSCGTKIDDNARFCKSCGAAMSAGAAASPAAAPAAAPPSSGSGLKVVLIVLAVIIGLGILGTLASVLVGMRMLRRSQIQTGPGETSITSPLGNVTTSQDPAVIAKQLGVDVYPGARPLRSAGAVNIAGFKIVGANFESDDSPDKVISFYESRFPKAEVSVKNPDRSTLVVNTSGGVIAIDISRQGDGSRIKISNIGGGKPAGEETN